jgi:hypothetical protein
MMTLFLCLCKFTVVPFGYICAHRSGAQKCVCVCVRERGGERERKSVCLCVCELTRACAVAWYIAWFRNYMQSSPVNKVIKNVDIYRCMHGIAECHMYLQVIVG